MPYDIDNPPEKLKDYDSKKQRQWVHVFNSCFDKYGDEAKCHKMAYGVTNKEPDYLNDPERDILLEFEVQEKMADLEMQEMISKQLGHLIVFDESETA